MNNAISAAMRADTLPEGTHAGAAVERFEVSEQAAMIARVRAAVNPTEGGRGGLPAGTYTRLRIDGALWMSDTPDELHDHLPFVMAASGSVLVTGLGLGCVVRGLLANPAVTHVTVVEQEPRIVALVSPSFAARPVTVLTGDAYTPDRLALPPGARFAAAWHDIWPTIDDTNLPMMARLMRRWAPYVTGAQACWSRPEAIAMARQMERAMVVKRTDRWGAARRYRARLKEAGR